jgi:hypothetical protein
MCAGLLAADRHGMEYMTYGMDLSGFGTEEDERDFTWE